MNLENGLMFPLQQTLREPRGKLAGAQIGGGNSRAPRQGARAAFCSSTVKLLGEVKYIPPEENESVLSRTISRRQIAGMRSCLDAALQVLERCSIDL
jgi:hypothetical protein